MPKQGKPLTAAEFEQWLKPADALARLPTDWPFRTKRDWIYSRIADGSIIALARTAIGQERGREPERATLAAINPVLWGEPFVTRDRDFWVTGDIGFDDTPGIDLMWTMEPKDDQPTRVYTFRGVRIEPTSFARELGDDAPPAEPSPDADETESSDKRPVDPASLKRWHELFSQLHPGAVEEQAIKSAKAQFPDHHVPRHWVRELRGPQKRGKPPKTS